MKRFWKLIRLVLREAVADDLTGEAAKTAFYLFLSFFPMVLVLFAFTGMVGGEEAFRWIMGYLRQALPGQAERYLADYVREITGDSQPAVLSVGVLLTLWIASNIFAALTDGLNRMYDLRDTRSWWRRRLLAVGVLLGGLGLLGLGAVALLVGPEIPRFLGVESLASDLWGVLRWPVVFALLVLILWLLYLVLPGRGRRPAAGATLVGAVAGAGVWILATLLFRLYVTSFGRFGKIYGVVGGIIVLLLWLYLTALSILFGGEVAATLEQKAGDDWEVGHPPRHPPRPQPASGKDGPP